MVGPDYERPSTEVAGQWTEAGQPGVRTTPAQTETWWRSLNDPALDRLVETAYRNNLSLQVAGVRVLQARAELGATVGQLYPQQQVVSGDLTYLRESENSATHIPFRDPTLATDQFGISAAWEIDFWGKVRRAIQSADASFVASAAAYDAALVSLVGDVASTYTSLRTFDEQLRIAQQNIVLQREGLRIATVRYENGETSALDVQQASTTLAETEAQVPQLQANRTQLRNALAVLLGTTPDAVAGLVSGTGVIPTPPTEVAVGIPVDLLRRRPDVQQAELQAIAQSAEIGVAKANLFPAFSLSGSFGFQSSNTSRASLSDVFSWNSRTYSVGPAVQLPIFNYGQLTNQVRVQDALFQQALLNYQNTVLQAQQEVENGLTTFLEGQKAVANLESAVGSAQKAADLALVRYKEGANDYTTVLTAQQALLRVEDSLATARGSVVQGLVSVYVALGGGWEIRRGQDVVSDETKKVMGDRTNWGGLLDPAEHQPSPQDDGQHPIRPPDW
jgi:NodT family efflux transporter outer membrane factor (OMF) lipoprotein